MEEVCKLTAKRGDLEKQLEKLKEKAAKSDYKEKVPAKVQEADAEKVSTTHTHTHTQNCVVRE